MRIVDYLKKFLFFAIVLCFLYFLWLPLSFPYQWLRLKLSYLLLNLFGFYPKFIPPSQNLWLGEYFSFLPYLALMITTYRKNVIKHGKAILLVMVVLIFLETIGRFFSELAIFYPNTPFVEPIAIFLLATARPALPFLFWIIDIQKDNKTSVH